MKRKISILVLTLIVLALAFAIGKGKPDEQPVCINEVRSWDASAARNGYYGSDYIELYNASSEEISLEGWYVSDDAADITKCRLSGVSIGPKGYVLLCANGKNDGGISLNFKINPAGEKIFLSDPESSLVDSIYVPEQEFGTVYARMVDGAKQWCVKEETAEYSNNEAKVLPIRSLEAPVFSHESGFYDEAFVLTLTAGQGETIYYTLDGSAPTEDSLIYKDGILINNISEQPNVCSAVRNVVPDWKDYTPDETLVDKAVIVRAAAVRGENQISDVVTNTYFVDEETYKEKNVLSIAAGYEDFFGNEGIFITGEGYDAWYLEEEGSEWVAPNFLQSGRSWEIPGNLQLLEKGRETLNQRVGIRTQGASTRMYAKKRMSLFAREEYSGSQYFEGLEFEGRPSHAFSLNQSLANVALPELVKDRDVAVARAKETVVFLNGEYWYDTYVLEKYNKYYLEETYGVNRDNVILIKNRSVSEGPEESFDIYVQLLNYVANTDLSVEENYMQLEQMADMQSYIDYIAANVYLCNMDMSEIKNYLLWRTIENDGTEAGDGRWRWLLYDTDCLEWMNCGYYGESEKAAVNSFAEKMEYTETAINEHTLFASAKNSEKFCRQFVLSFLDMANVNFSMGNVEKVFAKWNSSSGIYGDFFKNRFDYMTSYLAEEFGLTGTLEEVTININEAEGGSICLNTTTPDLSDGSWTGRYYTDYPITLTAVPEEGYRFVGWSGSVTSDSAKIEAEVMPGGIMLEAVFEKIAE